jgi:hypothetical protein
LAQQNRFGPAFFWVQFAEAGERHSTTEHLPEKSALNVIELLLHSVLNHNNWSMWFVVICSLSHIWSFVSEVEKKK